MGTELTDISTLSRAELLDMADKLKWVHCIDLGDGYTTKGIWGSHNPELHRAMADIDFKGKTVLDIGCWDGIFAFEAERRGAAAVYATDLSSQRVFSETATFEIAKRALNSAAIYYPDMSVYDVEKLGVRFDVVLYPGVYYHVKDPLLSLATLRRVMNDGAIILVEGAVLLDKGSFAKFFYKDVFCADTSNWWVPTIDCLRQWVECCYFEITKEYGPCGHMENQRHVLLAKAVRRHDPLYSRPDERLDRFES